MAKKSLTKEEKAEKARIAALPDNELTPIQLAQRMRGRAIGEARKGKIKEESPINQPKIISEASEGDYLETPVTFYHHRFRHCDFGYTDHKGNLVTPPGGESEERNGKVIHYVRFVEFLRSVVKDPSGPGHMHKCACRYITNSKKMAEYYRNHKDYNVTIYESAAAVDKVDASVADIMEVIASKMVGITNNDIIDKAKALSIPISADLTRLRKKVIEKMASDQVMQQVDKQRKVSSQVKKKDEEESTMESKAY